MHLQSVRMWRKRKFVSLSATQVRWIVWMYEDKTACRWDVAGLRDKLWLKGCFTFVWTCLNVIQAVFWLWNWWHEAVFTQKWPKAAQSSLCRTLLYLKKKKKNFLKMMLFACRLPTSAFSSFLLSFISSPPLSLSSKFWLVKLFLPVFFSYAP